VATIRSTDPANPSEKSFRYAPLSTGLDIVRKTLSQQEIATVQTTSIDESAGIVRLSTVLAHASGEWIASDWPVCSISETATPHRMGAALTYARRYALFTLVGIAGEDDVDSPDLVAPTSPAAKPAGNEKRRLNGSQGLSTRPAFGRQAKATVNAPRPILEVEPSAALRDELLGQLKDVRSTDQAAHWARRVLSIKISLTAADAESVERVFEARLASFVTDCLDELSPRVDDSRPGRAVRPKKRRSAVDKSMLALPAPRRIRDREHVKSVAKQACLICGRLPADAHHLRFAQSPALGRKVSDEFTVPLCRGHHREVHRCGDEAAWWHRIGINPTITARALWLQTHPLLPPRTSKLLNEPNSEISPHDHLSSNRG